MQGAVQRPTLIGVRIQQVEDGGNDSAVIGCLGSRVRDHIAGDADFGAPVRRHMGDDKGDQHQRPQYDDQREPIVCGGKAPTNRRSSHVIGLETVRVGQARHTLALKLLRDEPGIDQLAAQILGQRACIALIVHDMRRDQHEQLGARPRVALGR